MFTSKPKSATSFLGLPAIKCFERVKDPGCLTPQVSLIAARTIERENSTVGASTFSLELSTASTNEVQIEREAKNFYG